MCLDATTNKILSLWYNKGKKHTCLILLVKQPCQTRILFSHLVWPPLSKPVSNSPFLAEMTWERGIQSNEHSLISIILPCHIYHFALHMQSKTVSCKRMASARYEQQQTFLNTFSFRMQCHIYQLKYLIPSPIESAKSVRSRCRSMGYFIWFSRQLKASGKITCKKLLLMFRTRVKTLKLDIWLWSHNP